MFLRKVGCYVFFMTMMFLAGKPQEVVAQKKNNPKVDSLFWRIVSPDGQKTSYLYGSIHIIDEKHFALPDSAMHCFKQTELLLTEIDLRDKASITASYQQLMLPKGYSIRDYVSLSELKKLDSIWHKMKFNEFEIMSFKMTKPIFWSGLILNKLIESPHEGYDMNFTHKAESSKKNIIGLETASYTMSQVDSIPLEVQFDEVIKTLNNLKKSKRELKKMIEHYQQRKIYLLMKEINEGMIEMPGMEERLLVERNLHWMSTLKANLSVSSCFVVVGAAHLFGEKGLLRLLLQDGYFVEPMRRK